MKVLERDTIKDFLACYGFSKSMGPDRHTWGRCGVHSVGYLPRSEPEVIGFLETELMAKCIKIYPTFFIAATQDLETKEECYESTNVPGVYRAMKDDSSFQAFRSYKEALCGINIATGPTRLETLVAAAEALDILPSGFMNPDMVRNRLNNLNNDKLGELILYSIALGLCEEPQKCAQILFGHIE